MRKTKRSFLFDRMLGKLCTKMRMLGVDARLNPEGENGRFLVNAMREGRTAVTRARSAGDRPGPKAVVLRADDVNEQIIELFTAIGESPRFEPFSRCMECNALLVEESEEAVKGKVPPYVESNFHQFHRCPECGRIYWEGSHFQAMSNEVRTIEERLKRQ
jgi:uncharacterized protein with PIN domain